MRPKQIWDWLGSPKGLAWTTLSVTYSVGFAASPDPREPAKPAAPATPRAPRKPRISRRLIPQHFDCLPSVASL